MTLPYFQEVATKAIIFSTSGIFLAWYILAKIAVWPWGAGSY